MPATDATAVDLMDFDVQTRALVELGYAQIGQIIYKGAGLDVLRGARERRKLRGIDTHEDDEVIAVAERLMAVPIHVLTVTPAGVAAGLTAL